MTRLSGAGPDPGVRPAGHRDRTERGDPGRVVHRHRRARTRAASRRCCGRCPGCSPEAGAVLLDGRRSRRTGKEVARRLGLLPQTAVAPEGITVADLVARGRYPHQKLLRQWTPRTRSGRRGDGRHRRDRARRPGRRRTVRRPAAAGLDGDGAGPADRRCCCSTSRPRTSTSPTRSRSWTCAPTCNEQGRTLVAVLHDLNQAARYATHLIAMKAGAVVAAGDPSRDRHRRAGGEVFGLKCEVIEDPQTGTPLVVPASRSTRRARL